MKFNRRARLDTSQIQDRRRSGGFPGGKAGLAGGGGAVAVIIAIVVSLMGGSGGGAGDLAGSLLQQLGAGDSSSQVADNEQLEQSCRTGADAETKEDCTVVAIVNSVQDYWAQAMRGSGIAYSTSPTVFYSGATTTACGRGSADMGPFYCPGDQNVYIDLTFWNDLGTRFGSDASAFTQSYVIAHEYGHHVQDLLGTMSQVESRSGATSDAVRLELQADCYAGAWAKHASTVPGDDGQVLISDITDDDIANAVDTAGRIGDDWIQRNLGGRDPDPSTYTHGTATQRQTWFQAGFDTGDPNQCDTFGASDLG